MGLKSLALWAALPLLARTQMYGSYSHNDMPMIAGNGSDVRDDGKYEVSSEGIRALFIPYGASMSNLFIQDTRGVERDIVLGFDNASYYSVDELHPHLNGVPGRYANRIKNSSFTIDGETYNTNPNDNDGLNTLHGGENGYDWRNWTVVAHTTSSITFALTDEDGEQGFPGQVISLVTYTLTPYQWHIKMTATSTTKKTPIMLSQHTYWNLDGYQNTDINSALNHTIHLPYSGQRVAVDNILIPTGEILPNTQNGVNDWWSAPKQLGANITAPEAEGNCGLGCTGYDTCYLVNRAQNGPYDWRNKPVATLASPWSGIQVDVYTDQEAFQIFDCNNMPGTLALKETQGFFDDADRPRVVEQYGCVVMEVQDWIDAINNPEWQRDERQIFGPGDNPYVLEATYNFSLNRDLACAYNETMGHE